MVDRVFLVQRQSPAWAELARSQRNGLSIDPAHYLPPMPVPGFPAEIPRLIQVWNDTFTLDYFTCRAILKDIASVNNRSANGVSHISYTDYSMASDLLLDSIIYFHDDDDIFDTELSNIVSSVNFSDFDALVSPLIRLDSDLFTFVRKGCDTSLLLGRRQDFHFRYQTNNYGLVGKHIDHKRFTAMKDHVEASSYADANDLTDKVISRPLSATLKTIWSASMLTTVDQGKDAVLNQLQRFRSRVLNLELPIEYNWLSSCIEQACALMNSVQIGDDYKALEATLQTIRENTIHLTPTD